MRAKFAHWSGPNRQGDIDYAYIFREVANRLTAEERAKLSTGGFFLEHLFPGIDPDFPKEITFTSLNEPNPVGCLANMPGYLAAQLGRKVWMIDWWEFDGEEWFPQFRANWQEQMYDNCVEYGVEGISLVGWKLSGVEHNVRFLSEYAWNPKLTGKWFYSNYVERLYGPAGRGISSIYEQYDRFEPQIPCSVAGGPNMHFSQGWAALPLPSAPGKTEGLEDTQWKTVIGKISDHLAGLRWLDDIDQRSIASLNEVLPGLDKQGQSYARLMMNRLQVRRHYLASLMSMDEALSAYDSVGRRDGIDKAKVAAAGPMKACVESARKAIEAYAKEVRNRNDQGVVAQMNEQYYQILKRFLVSLGTIESSYATIDWTTFRLHPAVNYDFSGQLPWTHRDGKTSMSAESIEGRQTLKLEIGGDNVEMSSVLVDTKTIDLKKAPYLDFRIRTSTTDPLAIMFQCAAGNTWYALNLIGKQSQFTELDCLPDESINDGQWRRVVWDLERLCTERAQAIDGRIRNVIIGSWQKPARPIVVEFQSFAFGKRNTLD